MEEIFKSFIELAKKLPTRDEMVAFTKKALDTIALSEVALFKRLDARLAQIKDGKDGKDGAQGPKGDKGDKGDKGERGATFIAMRGAKGEDGAAGKDGSPDTPVEVRDKLESIEQEDDKLKIEAVGHLKEKLDELDARPTGGTRTGWGAHPLTIQGLGVTIDKNTRFINFKGTGVASVTRSKDGVVNVTITAGGAGSGTLVSEETPTDTGDHTTFTLANTPDTGTLRVYRGGARQQSIGVTPDYSLSGTTLTLTTALQTGEVLMVDYQYT